jgi:hypothetical protein
LIGLYPDGAKAAKAAESFLRNSLPDSSDGMAKLPDGRWTGCRLKDNRLGIVFNAPTREDALSYLERIGAGRPPAK